MIQNNDYGTNDPYGKSKWTDPNTYKNMSSADYKREFDNFTNKTHEVVGRHLTRSDSDKMVAGVLGGIGETYNINTSLLRVLFILSLFLPGPQFLAYLAAWFIIPKR